MTGRTRSRPASDARGGAESGSASVQIVILMPALFLMMFVGMQAALVYHGRTVALAAASEGARAAAAEAATVGAGQDAAEAFIASAGGEDVLGDVIVTTTPGTTTITVVVSGTTLSVVPGWVPRIVQSTSASIERLTG